MYENLTRHLLYIVDMDALLRKRWFSIQRKRIIEKYKEKRDLVKKRLR